MISTPLGAPWSDRPTLIISRFGHQTACSIPEWDWGGVAIGLVGHEEVVVAFEFFDFLARICGPGDQGAIDCCYPALSIVESEAHETINEVALAA